MSTITLNNSDFQSIQDQLVDLKARNYDLAEQNRRGQADFEAAKAKIVSLQLKLEEQERDFQVVSTTLRREIEAVTGGSGLVTPNLNCDNELSAKHDQNAENAIKCKELALKLEELDQKYQESKEIAQQLDNQNRELIEKLHNIEAENAKFKDEINNSSKVMESLKKESELNLAKAIKEMELSINEDKQKLTKSIEAISTERDTLKKEVDNLTLEMSKFEQKLREENEERKIQERRGVQMVKELKRQLAQEKNRSETLQKRIEHLLSNPPAPPTPPMETSPEISAPTAEADIAQLSTSSNATNGNGSGGNTNQDTNSVSSWSFVPVKTTTSTTSFSAAKSNSNVGLNETLSLCSVGSEDRETVQRLCDTTSSESSSAQRNAINTYSDSRVTSNSAPVDNECTPPPAGKPGLATNLDYYEGSSTIERNTDVYFPLPASLLSPNDWESKGMLLEEQAALVERLTKLQQDKWKLEEKVSYMEQANSSLTEDLANKSDIIRQYFMDKAMRTISSPQPNSNNHDFHDNNHNNSRRLSFTSSMNQIISEKAGLKKVVDFLKEKSHNPLLLSVGETDNISREATKKMQIMLEETLIKCLKLQENLDFVTSELNKTKS